VLTQLGARARIAQVRSMALHHQRSVELEHLADEAAILVAVVDHDRLDPDVDADEIEPQIRYSGQALAPVPAQRGVAADDAVRAFYDPGGDR
jgi:hypothetical protein